MSRERAAALAALHTPDRPRPGSSTAVSITDTSPAVRSLDNIIADLRDVHDHTVRNITAGRAEADEQIHALKVTAARLAEEAEGERLRANGLEAAGIALTADAIRREEALTAELRRANGEIAGHLRVNLALQGLLDDAGCETRRLSDHIRRLVAENTRLRTELDAAQTQPQPSRFGWRRGGGSIGSRL